MYFRERNIGFYFPGQARLSVVLYFSRLNVLPRFFCDSFLLSRLRAFSDFKEICNRFVGHMAISFPPCENGSTFWTKWRRVSRMVRAASTFPSRSHCDDSQETLAAAGAAESSPSTRHRSPGSTIASAAKVFSNDWTGGPRPVPVSRLGRRPPRALLLAARSHRAGLALLRPPCALGRPNAVVRVGPDRLSPLVRRHPDGCYQVLSVQRLPDLRSAGTEAAYGPGLSTPGDPARTTMNHCDPTRDATPLSLNSVSHERMWPASLTSSRLNATHESVGTGPAPDAPHHPRGFGSGVFAFSTYLPRLSADDQRPPCPETLWTPRTCLMKRSPAESPCSPRAGRWSASTSANANMPPPP